MTRLVGIWSCLAFFLFRVVGQIEVLLLAPSWLPHMAHWYSGLLPYPLLLPAQILLLMFMTALAWRCTVSQEPVLSAGRRRFTRGFANTYFLAMLARLGVQFAGGAANIVEAGGIPVAFHCVLALYIRLIAAETSSNGAEQRAEANSVNSVRHAT